MTASQLYRLARPRTLTAAFSPVILGASYAATLHTAVQSLWLSLFYTLLILICVMSSQIAANIWNEYFDFKSGLDLNQAAGNSGTIVREGISPQQVKKLGYIFSLTPLASILVVIAGRRRLYSDQLILLGRSKTDFAHTVRRTRLRCGHGFCHCLYYGLHLDGHALLGLLNPGHSVYHPHRQYHDDQ